MSEATEDLEWKLGLLKETKRRSWTSSLLSDCQSRIEKLKRGEEELLIRVARGEHMPDYQNHYSGGRE